MGSIRHDVFRKSAGIAVSVIVVLFILWSVLGVGQIVGNVIGWSDDPELPAGKQI